MKIILLQDIEGLGKKYDVKTVKNGYARNFLIPKNLAEPATNKMLKKIKELKEKAAKEAEMALSEVQKTASELDGQEIEFLVKTGKEDQLFEAITPLKIAKKLKEMGFEIKKSQIALAKPIKELGEFPVKINFEHQLEANVTLIVEPEEVRREEEEEEE